MVVLEGTLGSKQGTLWKAPRNAEKDSKDTNCFTRNDFWQLVACKASIPLPVGDQVPLVCCMLSFVLPPQLGLKFDSNQAIFHECDNKGEYVTPESGTFLSHEHGRSLTEFRE